MQRITRPYNSQRIFFQGIIFVPRCFLYIGEGKTVPQLTACNVSKIDISFGNLLKAVFPLDAGSKLGGPIAGQQKWTPPSSWPHVSAAYPVADKPAGSVAPSTNPHEWWRWALILMYPSDNVRMFGTPGVMTAEEMGSMFQMYQLIRHVRTKLKVMATDDMDAKWSPIASLLVQDMYFENRANNYNNTTEWMPGKQPLCGKDGSDCNEKFIPSRPSADQRFSYSNVTCYYTGSCYPSFITLSALGSGWAFPPQQQPVSRRSFNKHSMKGRNDPLYGPWMQLLPKNLYTVDAPAMAKGDLNTIVGTLFLAQGSNMSRPYKFMTAMYKPDNAPFKNNAWAVVKITSEWILGNTRRPYFWDVSWANTVDTIP